MNIQVRGLIMLLAVLFAQTASAATPNPMAGTLTRYSSPDCTGEPESIDELPQDDICPIQYTEAVISFRRGETSLFPLGMGVQVRCFDEPTVETPNRLVLLSQNGAACADPSSNIVGEVTSITDNFDDEEAVKLCITDQDQDEPIFDGKSFVLSCPVPTSSPTPPTTFGPSASPITFSPSLSPSPEPTTSPESPTTVPPSSGGHVGSQLSSTVVYFTTIVAMIGFMH